MFPIKMTLRHLFRFVLSEAIVKDRVLERVYFMLFSCVFFSRWRWWHDSAFYVVSVFSHTYSPLVSVLCLVGMFLRIPLFIMGMWHDAMSQFTISQCFSKLHPFPV